MPSPTLTHVTIPAGQVCQYGSYVFPVTTRTLSVDVHPVPDSSGRTTKWSEFSLAVEFTLAGAATDATVRAILAQLTKYGEPLSYQGRGIPIAINVGRSRDSNWGPKPEVVSFKPHSGPGNACRVQWRVTGHIPTCSDATFDGWPAEFTYRLKYSVDGSGLTTRVYSGKIQIPGTRPAGGKRTMPDSVDYWRERITPPLPLRFRRSAQDFDIAEDKLTCTFSITDTQLPGRNVPPPGIVKASFSHTIANPPGKLYTWDVTCTGNYELGINTRPEAAIRPFFGLVAKRKTFALRQLAAAPRRADGSKSTPAIVPVQFSMTEPDAYGPRAVQLTLRYTITDANMEEMLNAAGFWRSTDDDPREWRTSMADLLGPRGVAGIVFTTNDDYLVDLCQTTHPEVPSEPKVEVKTLVAEGPRRPMEKVFPKPPPESSWMRYGNRLRVEVQSNNVPVVTLPAKPMTDLQDAFVAAALSATGAAQGAAWDIGTAGMPNSTKGLAINDSRGVDKSKYGRVEPQRRGRPVTYVIMEGYAMRVGYPIPRPDLLDVGGVKPVPMDRAGIEGFEHEVIGNAGEPLYAARWRFRYMVPDSAGTISTLDTIDVPPNSLEGMSNGSV